MFYMGQMQFTLSLKLKFDNLGDYLMCNIIYVFVYFYLQWWPRILRHLWTVNNYSTIIPMVTLMVVPMEKMISRTVNGQTDRIESKILILIGH